MAVSCFAAAEAAFKVDTSTNYIIDEYGRTRIFHGVNAVEKIFPWHPVVDHFDAERSLSAEDARNLRMWGFNIVRLGTMWPGLEATRNSYNMTYLKEIGRIVDLLGKEGIVTLLDLHQDLLSPYWCGEGVPDWAAIAQNLTFQFPKPAVWEEIPKDPNGYANLKTCLKWVFGVFYLSEAVNAGFQSLYDNVNGIQDSFVAFWRTVATYFANNENVIGFELINEPWAGNAFRDPWYLLSQGLGDKINLAPMYDRAAAAIRQLPGASKKLVFYESATIDQVWGTKNGFTTGPNGAQWNETNVYSYHSYCTLSDRDGNPYSRPLCDAVDAYLFEMWTNTYKRLGGGGMMTEWGALSSSPGAMQQIHRISSLADEYIQSWIWWQFKDYDDVTTASIGDVESFYDSKGQLQVEKVKALSRTYAQAISGTPLAMKFNTTTSEFSLDYVYGANIPTSQPTIIFLNQAWYYPRGYNVVLNPASHLSYSSSEPNYVQIWHSASLAPGVIINVKIVAL
jgi:endoglycosylceramidase